MDKIKDGAEVSALANDINQLATATNTALEAAAGATNAAIASVIAGRYKNAIVIPDGTDLDTLKTPGIYYVRLDTSAETITNRPPGVAAGPFVMEILASPFGYTAQNFYGYNDTVAALGQYAGAANKVRRDDFSYRRGGTKFTNGLGAVALRFDHGLTNLKANILPLLRARALPFGVAINSRNWALAENSGATQTDVQGWVTNDKCEVWNHAADHNDASNPEKIYDRIVTGLAELKAQIPNASIDGYFIPGVDGTGYMGFNIGETPDVFYQTVAGRLILENHAVTSGGFPGTAYRVLDGTIRQGQGHYTIEAQTVAGIKTRIDTVIASKQGLQIMLHPSLLNAPGYLTTAQLAEVLDYIKAKQTAGTLAVLSPYDLLLADSGTATTTTVEAAQAAAISDATTKYGGLPARVTAVEGVNTTQSADIAGMQSKLVDRGNLPAATDLNAYKGVEYQGVWTANANAVTGGTGWPVGFTQGKVFVLGNGVLGYQLAFQYSVAPAISYRNTTNSAGAWNAWVNLSSDDVRYRGIVPSGANIDTYRGAPNGTFGGVWQVANPAIITGLPAGAGKNGELHVSGSVGFQTYKEYSGTPAYWFRGINNASFGTWSDWVNLTATSSAPKDVTYYAEERAARVADALLRVGGKIGTGGKAVVMLRMDDYPDTFLSKVVPVLEAYDLPCYWAATVNHVENLYPTSWATLNTAAIQSGVQLTGHSWSHGNATTAAGVTHELIESADYFEEMMPASRIDVWTQPSVGGAIPYDVGDGGYDSKNPSLHKSYAGRLLLSRYPVINGARPGFYHPQGGGVDAALLQANLTYESFTLANFKMYVDEIVAGGYATDLMLHPGRLDTGGYMTTAVFDQCMAYLAQLRAEGTLMVLSGLAKAALDPGTTWRHDLFPKDMGGWSKGTLIAGVRSVAAVDQTTKACHADRYTGLRGSIREVYAKVRSAVANTIQVEIKALDGSFTVTKEYAIPGDNAWHEIRKFVLLPYNLGATYVQFGYKSTAAAAFDITEAHAYAA